MFWGSDESQKRKREAEEEKKRQREEENRKQAREAKQRKEAKIEQRKRQEKKRIEDEKFRALQEAEMSALMNGFLGDKPEKETSALSQGAMSAIFGATKDSNSVNRGREIAPPGYHRIEPEQATSSGKIPKLNRPF